ncbi:MAG: hypothetical protein GX430_04290 [Treponema sp.]|nr:hypothetical protein [Treponema sp.]
MPDSLYLKYIKFHREVETDFPEMPKPSTCVASDWFVKIPGRDQWKPVRDRVGSPVVEALLRLVDEWGLPARVEKEAAGPGGWGAGGMRIWVPFLDGGLYVETTLWEGEYSNRLHSRQTTRILGKACRELLWKGLSGRLESSEIPAGGPGELPWPRIE